MLLPRLIRTLPCALMFTDQPGEQGGGDPAAAGGDPPTGDPEYPAGTALKDMTTEQREAYWRAKSQEHEKRSKANHRDLQAAEEKLRKSLPDADRALAEAREEGKRAALRDTAAERVRDVATARLSSRVSGDQLDALLESVPARLIGDDGTVDRKVVEEWADKVAPAPADPPADQQPAKPRGPSAAGLGRPQQNRGTSGVSAGRDAYASRRPRPAATA